MLIFIIPLKSARVSASWEHVSRLVTRTISSVCAQTSPRFHALVVCHEVPEGEWADPRLEFIPVDYSPPPSPEPAVMRDDRWRKYYIGLERALDYSPSHVMFVDGDDCVSNRLAGFVADRSAAPGWYIRSGYFYSERQTRVYLTRRRFNQWCGSSYIIRPEHIRFLVRADNRLKIPHRLLVRQLRQRGTSLRPLPFRGAVYCVSHGENFRDYEPILWPSHPLLRLARRLIGHRSPTPRIGVEYGLYPANPGAGGGPAGSDAG